MCGNVGEKGHSARKMRHKTVAPVLAANVVAAAVAVVVAVAAAGSAAVDDVVVVVETLLQLQSRLLKEDDQIYYDVYSLYVFARQVKSLLDSNEYLRCWHLFSCFFPTT